MFFWRKTQRLLNTVFTFGLLDVATARRVWLVLPLARADGVTVNLRIL